ncbi:DNA ligase [Vibrio metschnikovii]|nr:DNA ligase [Vibrio metschnikovii]
MTVFELLNINPGDEITVNNPWGDGERKVVPLALSKHGISIRSIDTRYGDICYVAADWLILMSDGEWIELQYFPHIKQKVNEWEDIKRKQQTAKQQAQQVKIQREFATIDEILSTLNLKHVKVAITGTLPLPRAQVKSMLEGKGAIVMESISKNSSFLIMGDTGKYEITSKMKKAHELGVKIITL